MSGFAQILVLLFASDCRGLLVLVCGEASVGWVFWGAFQRDDGGDGQWIDCLRQVGTHSRRCVSFPKDITGVKGQARKHLRHNSCYPSLVLRARLKKIPRL